MKRVHIVGCPRSGTTLLMELISTCYVNDGFCEHEKSIFEAVPDVAQLYLSKQPSDIKHIKYIFFQDPKLFIIYLTRDPRAVVSSKHRDNPNEYFCNYRVCKDCENAAQAYKNHPRFIALRYEDLVSNPNQCQEKIDQQFSFINRKHLFSEFEQYAAPSEQAVRAMNGFRSVNTDSLARWKQHLPRIKEQVENNPGVRQDIQQLAYEMNDHWLDLLHDIEAQRFPCRYPDKAPRFKEMEKRLRIWIKSKLYLKRRRAQ